MTTYGEGDSTRDVDEVDKGEESVGDRSIDGVAEIAPVEDDPLDEDEPDADPEMLSSDS